MSRHEQDAVSQQLSVMAAGDTTVTTTAWIDTLNYEYAQVFLRLNTGASTEATFDALNITESDTSAASATSAIVNLTGTTNTVTSTSAGFVIPANLTTSGSVIGSVIRFDIPLQNRKRFLYLTATPGTNGIWCADVMLHRKAIVPSASNASVTRVVNALAGQIA